MVYLGNAVTNVGNVKKVNQDSLTLKIADTEEGLVCLAVVCDGLGGLDSGEVASATVVRAFENWFINNISFLGGVRTESVVERTWKELLFFVNKKIIDYGKERNMKLGTTVTAVLFVNDKYYAVHVGDSRLYRIKQTVQQITRDHTVVEQESGTDAKTEVLGLSSQHSSNVLWQCVGVTEDLKPDFLVGEVEAGTGYLLCSDGFRHVITHKEMWEYCNVDCNATDADMKDNLERLVALNMERGERDNISAILVTADE